MSDYETILIEREGRVARVSFNRPDKLNSFNGTQRREFLRAAQEVNADNDIWVVILTGAGRAFGAGADLSDTSEPMPNGGEGVEDQLNAEYKPGVLAIHHARKPWLAAINGPCAGISYSFAMACDLVVMSEDAYIKQAFVNIALIPDGGLNWLLTRTVGYRLAYQMAIEGNNVSAKRCLELGLANKVVPHDQLMHASLKWAESLSKKSSQSLRETKRVMRMAMTNDYESVFEQEAEANNTLHGSKDSLEAIQAFFEKREPNFD